MIEVYSANGWERYADASVSMHSSGKSLPSKDTCAHFGFLAESIEPKVKDLVEEVRRDGGDFRDLNGTLRIGLEHYPLFRIQE